MLKSSRNKGHAYERTIVQLFKELGWPDACTSRSESKRKDDEGIDCCYTDPFQIQAKAVEKLGSYHAILEKMKRRKGMYNLIFHKRNRQGTIVAMELDDFLEILQMLIKNGIIKP